jgi:hypothetical protein
LYFDSRGKHRLGDKGKEMMTLNELSRYYWARMNQASYMDGAINQFGRGDEEGMWYCLLNWAHYMGIADDMTEIGFGNSITESRGYFK